MWLLSGDELPQQQISKIRLLSGIWDKASQLSSASNKQFNYHLAFKKSRTLHSIKNSVSVQDCPHVRKNG